ncbi:bifunctional metallophosphatase/5'-nucleotidase [Ferrimonas sediminicola]|uniref:Bifunctional metallophosphatase/5'-nucleotidase n=1 Tax=Ferrimonas sediminicola TaxID=2569538 RepID=A0A4U1BFH8_9GAMM|nr:bifunctional UDP-sugar hydrolase/5'-nucleotidase [Ferrimonas sediminicola]TKB49437.1 bifunctional metallophosphatase/5'-nucleotidase [Ferrimonas sediminicola]
MTEHRPLSLTLAHLNDSHSHFDASRIPLTLPGLGTVFAECGGYARLCSAVDRAKSEARDEQRHLLLVHAGDCFQGSLYFAHFKGTMNAVLNNQLDLDAMALGNHEFDLGNPPLAEFLDHIQFPMLSANLDLSQEDQAKENPMRGKPGLLDYDDDAGHGRFLVRHFDGEPVALFGLSPDNMPELACADPDTHFLDCLTVARATVAAIRQRGINKIILLSHLGYDRDLMMAEQLQGVAAIIGGHTHTLQGHFDNLGLGGRDHYGVVIAGTVVVQAGCNALFLGRLKLDLNADGSLSRVDGGNLLLLGQNLSRDSGGQQALTAPEEEQAWSYLEGQDNLWQVTPDPTVHRLIEEHYRPEIREFERQKVAVASRDLRHIRIPDDKGGSDVAPLLAEAMRWQARQMGLETDFGLHNAGGTRASIAQGKVSAGWIAGTLAPFAIGVERYRLSGRELTDTLESAINNATNNGVVGTGTGSYPYAAGLRYHYQADAPMGERIRDLQVDRDGRWQPVQPEAIYYGVSTGYTAAGKEGYYPLARLPEPPQELGLTIAEAVIAHWQHLGTLD